MTTRLLLETLRQADDGRVECSVATPDGQVVHGVIEQSFFDEFVMVQPAPARAVAEETRKRNEEQRHQRIVRENVNFLEKEFDKQWRMGGREFILR